MTGARGIRVRPYRPADARALAEIYCRAVHEGTAVFYDAAQRAAWAPAGGPSPGWAERLGEQITVIAERGGVPLGFMTLGRDGHLDLAYVAPEEMGTGMAAALHDRLIAAAQDLGLRRLETEASHLARRFFLKQGWTEIAEQSVERGGQRLTNFSMEKRLHSR